MLFSSDNQLQDLIVKTLSEGPIKTAKLISKLKKQKPGTTKQGIYYALRILERNQVIVMKKAIVSLNVPWLTKLDRFVARALHKSVKGTLTGEHFANLAEEEKIQYSFKTFEQMNKYDNHIAISLIQLLDKNIPIYYYNQRQLFIYQPNEELELRQDFLQNTRQINILFGNKTEFDKQVMKNYQEPNLQYYFLDKPLFKNMSYYFGVLGDFITKYNLDLKLTQKIEKFYQSNPEYNSKSLTRLQTILKTPGKNKFTIIKNSKKASLLRSKMEKYFYLPKR